MTLAAAVAGVWFGEGPAPRISNTPIVLLFVLAASAYTAVPRRESIFKICGAAIVAAIFVAGWFAGAASANGAYNACILHGAEVRAALTAYHTRHGRYPANLQELHMSDNPCRRILRGDLLVYQPTDNGYQLRFTDGIVQHRATHDEAFIGIK